MNIERIYKKPSKHKYWKIILDWSWGSVDLKAYGISCNEGCKMVLGLTVGTGEEGTKNEYCCYVAKTRDKVLVKENLLLKIFYKTQNKKIKDSKTEHDRDISESLICHNKTIEYANETHEYNKREYGQYFDDPAIKLLLREDKLKRVLK